MSEKEIEKTFNGRWRIKGQNIQQTLEMMMIKDRIDYVKNLCRDFFEAGILLAEGSGSSVSSGESDVIVTDTLFDTWWNLYSKKIDRAKCEKKWNKLTLAEKQACIAATPAYVASTPELQFRRHPATYLNNKSWENQIIPRNNGTDKQAERNKRIAAVADRIAEYTKDTK